MHISVIFHENDLLCSSIKSKFFMNSVKMPKLLIFPSNLKANSILSIMLYYVRLFLEWQTCHSYA